MAKILITGSNGFVGQHLTKYLKKSESLTLVDCSEAQISDPSYRKIDLTSFEELSQLDETFDGIVHLAGISRVKDGEDDPQMCMKANLMSTTNILELARRSENPPWVVLAGTVEPPNNFYGLSKHLSEQIADYYAAKCGLSIISLKFSNIYGSTEDNPSKLIPILINSALKNKPIRLRDPEDKINLMFIDDLVEGIRLATKYIATKSEGYYESMDLCSAKSISVGELTKMIILISDSKSNVIHENNNDKQIDNASPIVPDPSRAIDLLGYNAAKDHKKQVIKTIRRYKNI